MGFLFFCIFFVFSNLGLDWVLFLLFCFCFFLKLKDQPLETFFLIKALLAKQVLKHLFDAIIAFTPNKVLLRKTCFLGRKKQTSLLSIYCASGGVLPGGAVHPVK